MNGFARVAHAVMGPPGSVHRVLTSTACKYGIKGAVILGLVSLLGLSLAVATAIYITVKITLSVATAMRSRAVEEAEDS
jgi:hypothetical protein